MRILTCVGIVDEIGIGTYAPTPVFDSLTIPEVYRYVKHLYAKPFDLSRYIPVTILSFSASMKIGPSSLSFLTT